MPYDRISYSYKSKLILLEFWKSLTQLLHESRFSPHVPTPSDQFVALRYLSPLITITSWVHLKLCGKRQIGGYIHQVIYILNVFLSKVTR